MRPSFVLLPQLSGDSGLHPRLKWHSNGEDASEDDGNDGNDDGNLLAGNGEGGLRERQGEGAIGARAAKSGTV